MIDITKNWTVPKLARYQIFMIQELADIKSGLCPICKKQIVMTDFTSDLQVSEYYISGMCHDCQDNFFNKEIKDL